jgi:hypothetical protein
VENGRKVKEERWRKEGEGRKMKEGRKNNRKAGRISCTPRLAPYDIRNSAVLRLENLTVVIIIGVAPQPAFASGLAPAGRRKGRVVNQGTTGRRKKGGKKGRKEERKKGTEEGGIKKGSKVISKKGGW